MLDARRETGMSFKLCRSFFISPHPVRAHSSSFFSNPSSFSQPAHPSSQALLKPFSKQISCKWSSFDFFSPPSCEKFPRKPVSFVVGVLSGSHWSAGNREHKGSRVAFKWGWEVVGLWRWEPVETENHSQFHMCLCVGISR